MNSINKDFLMKDFPVRKKSVQFKIIMMFSPIFEHFKQKQKTIFRVSSKLKYVVFSKGIFSPEKKIYSGKKKIDFTMELFSYFFQSITVWMNYILFSRHYIGEFLFCCLFQRKYSLFLYYKKKCISMVYVKDLATSLLFLEHNSADDC